MKGRKGLALVLSVGSLLSAACGGSGSSSGCHYESWQGRCKLTNVRTARVIDRFPKAYAVVEATYEPVMSEGAFSPPPFRKEMLAPAENEMALSDHIRGYADVACSVQNPVGDPCAPKMQAAVPDFVPQAQQVAAGPVGCQKIERSAGTAPVPSSVVMPGPMQFEENSSLVGPSAQHIADEAAMLILRDARIECVAIRGQSSPGEPFTVANERAQTVRRLLEARGIDHLRVTVFDPTPPAHTANPEDQPPLPEQRRVHLAVVVYAAAP